MPSRLPDAIPTERLLPMLDGLLGGVHLLDGAWRVRTINRAAAALWVPDAEARPQRLVGRVLWEANRRLAGTDFQQAHLHAVAAGAAITRETPSPVTGRSVRLRLTPTPYGLLVHGLDVEAHSGVEDELRRREAHLHGALRESGMVAARVDRALRYVWIYNPHPDFDPGAVLGRRDDELADNEGTRALMDLKHEVLETGRTVRRELHFPVSDGRRTYAVRGEPLRDDAGEVIGLTTVSIDLTELRQVEAESTTDFLTGVANRRGIEAHLEHELRRLARYEGTLSVALLDADRFKQINDTHGHAAGDAVLRELTDLLRATIRTVDRIGRWGGEEFLLLLPEMGAEEAMRAAERVRAGVARHEFAVAERVTLSVGVATARPDETARALVARADAALYRAKAQGRDRTALAAP